MGKDKVVWEIFYRVMLIFAAVCIFIGAGSLLFHISPLIQNRIVDWGVESIVEDVMPSVVHIMYHDENGPVWQGSGVIIDSDGLILTARHVIEKPGTYTVTLSNEKTFSTTKAVISKENDVGFIKINASNLPFSKFGNSDKMRLGSRVMVIGSPWGKEHFNSVTLGILSGMGLNYNEQPSFGWSILFQSDVPVNPGNSGGPAYNMQGEIVGVVVGFHGPGNYAGITYCVPSNVCKSLVKSVWLAIALQEVTPVEFDKRVSELEDWSNVVKEELWDFEWRLDDLEQKEPKVDEYKDDPHEEWFDEPWNK